MKLPVTVTNQGVIMDKDKRLLSLYELRELADMVNLCTCNGRIPCAEAATTVESTEEDPRRLATSGVVGQGEEVEEVEESGVEFQEEPSQDPSPTPPPMALPESSSEGLEAEGGGSSADPQGAS